MQALWYLSRATGVVTLILLTIVLALGVLVNRKGRLPGLPGFAVTGIHRSASLLAMALLAIHISFAIIDPYASLRWIDAVVPFASSYRPLWVGLGAFAFDLLLAVMVTSLLRGRIGRRTWRAVHWASYAVWPVALVHGLRTGKDLSSGLLLWVTLACIGVVVTAVVWRILDTARSVPRAERAHAVLADERTKHRFTPFSANARRRNAPARTR